jgi:hypothetical protein
MKSILTVIMIFFISTIIAFAKPLDPITFKISHGWFQPDEYWTLMDTDGDGYFDYLVVCQSSIIVWEGDIYIGGENLFSDPEGNNDGDVTLLETHDCNTSQYESSLYVEFDEVPPSGSPIGFIANKSCTTNSYDIVSINAPFARESEIDYLSVSYVISISPNPATDKLSISIESDENIDVSSIKLLSLTGVTLFQENVAYNHDFDLIIPDEIISGVYFIHLTINQEITVVKKIIIRR